MSLSDTRRVISQSVCSKKNLSTVDHINLPQKFASSDFYGSEIKDFDTQFRYNITQNWFLIKLIKID